MQTIGEEQTFQTLFRELRLENERVVPRFSVVWNSAQASARPREWYKPSFVVTAALVVVGLFSFAVWLSGGLRNRQQNTVAVIPSASPILSSAPPALKPGPGLYSPSQTSHRLDQRRQRLLRLAKHRRATTFALRESEIRNAVAVLSWHSPTAMLMHSPAGDVLSSLPQLYGSVFELNSFLLENQR